jgi:hypothetical protein
VIKSPGRAIAGPAAAVGFASIAAVAALASVAANLAREALNMALICAALGRPVSPAY